MYISTFTFINIYIYIYTYTYTDVCIYICLYVCRYLCVYIYIQMGGSQLNFIGPLPAAFRGILVPDALPEAEGEGSGELTRSNP